MNSYLLANCIFDAEPTLKHVEAAYAREERNAKQSARWLSFICGSPFARRQEEMPDQENHQIKIDQELPIRTHT
eukprot:s956_g6.t1